MTSFYRVGGDTRIAGFLLAVATTVLLLVGTGPIAYIREWCSGSRDQPQTDFVNYSGDGGRSLNFCFGD